MDRDDRKIADLFDGLRAEEARRAPDFDAMWGAARAIQLRRSRRRVLLRLAAAAALLAVLGVPAALRLRAPAPLPRAGDELPWKSAVLISQWRAPTDFLLDTSGRT